MYTGTYALRIHTHTHTHTHTHICTYTRIVNTDGMKHIERTSLARIHSDLPRVFANRLSERFGTMLLQQWSPASCGSVHLLASDGVQSSCSRRDQSGLTEDRCGGKLIYREERTHMRRKRNAAAIPMHSRITHSLVHKLTYCLSHASSLTHFRTHRHRNPPRSLRNSLSVCQSATQTRSSLPHRSTHSDTQAHSH
jgi:hypothetical protein